MMLFTGFATSGQLPGISALLTGSTFADAMKRKPNSEVTLVLCDVVDFPDDFDVALAARRTSDNGHLFVSVDNVQMATWWSEDRKTKITATLNRASMLFDVAMKLDDQAVPPGELISGLGWLMCKGGMEITGGPMDKQNFVIELLHRYAPSFDVRQPDLDSRPARAS